MIFDAIVHVILLVFSGILALIPAYTLPDSMATVGAGIGSAVAAANGVFPVTVLGGCIVVMIAARLFIVAWAGLVWLYTKIPGKFT